MRLAQLLILLSAAVLPGLGLLPDAAHGEFGAPRVPPAGAAAEPGAARVIVKYKALGTMMRSLRAGAGRGPQFAATLARRHGLALADGRIIEGRSQVVTSQGGLSSAALAAQLAADDEVEYAVPDGRRYALAAPNDPLYAASAAISPASGQWYLRPPDSTLVSAIDAEGAWAISTGSGVVVADLDTGVLFSHPDLAAKLYAGYDFVSSLTSAGDGNGPDSDATDPGDWTTTNECGAGQSAQNSSWHGTQTAGLLGAQTNNGVGMASAGNAAMVLPVRVLGKCGGSDSDIIAGMLWAGGVSNVPVANPHPARVLNLSFGGSGSCTAAYADAISQLTAAGVVVVVAAGNAEGLAVSVPGNCPGVITVAGLRHAGTKVGYSSVGPEVAIAAPAGNCVNTSGPPCLYPILTTINSGTTTATVNTYSDATNYSVGTSFATPLVAGTAALMLAANPALTTAQVKSLLQTSARAFPATSSDPTVLQCQPPSGVVQDECLCTTSTCGAGMLDAAAAVSAAAALALPVANIQPSATSTVAGSTLTFDGSGSTVPGGRTLTSYRWTITAGSAIAAISGASNAAMATVVTTGAGSVTVQLTVTDSLGLQASASSTVTVNLPAAPVPRILASASVVAAGSPVVFDGSGSSAASGFTIASYQWQITGGGTLASFSTPTHAASATVATQGAGSGSFTVTLTVTDSLGQAASTSSTVSVTPVTPIASISASAATVSAGGSVAFDGSGSTAAAGRTIGAYQWTITAGSAIAAISGSSTAATATVATTAAGTFTIQLTVTDSAGATDSRTASVTVNPVTATGAGTTSGGSGGGGGGAFGVGWLLALALAVVALARQRPGPA